jgi:hypothetical protein
MLTVATTRLRTANHMLRDGTVYQDLGGERFDRCDTTNPSPPNASSNARGSQNGSGDPDGSGIATPPPPGVSTGIAPLEHSNLWH